jgi:hypothetical protein
MLSFIGALAPPHPSTQGKLYRLRRRAPCAWPREHKERVSKPCYYQPAPRTTFHFHYLLP